MKQVLSIHEIETRFQSEWILIENPRTDESLVVQSGEVLFHSKDRDEVYREAIKLRPKRFGMLFTGKIPDKTAIVL